MDWFERLTGFREGSYRETQSRLEVRGDTLCSRVNGRCYQVGTLELASLHELREAVPGGLSGGRLSVTTASGDIRQLHREQENEGALFQVASQFNLLEMVGPSVTPEEGVTRYEGDLTQGPACAIAAGAATIYRNYFAPVGDQTGQTSQAQLDASADLRQALAERAGRPAEGLWTMRNGYTVGHEEGLRQVNQWLVQASPDDLDELRGKLRIGLHSDVEVTDGAAAPGQLVSQAFCSAVPVSPGYSRVSKELWAPVARLVLEAAYEATLYAALRNASRENSLRVLLTRLGGGAFGNPDPWIDEAIRRALRLFADVDLEVVLVSYNAPSRAALELVREFSSIRTGNS
jgi:hypothetical protein